jgi:hypothetical protein
LIKESGSEVERIDIEKDIDEDDFRYFLNKKFLEEEKDANQYYTQKRGQDPKKLDYFNKGKNIANLTKVNILDIIQKQNIAVSETPNQRVQITVRAVGFPFEIAEWLEKQTDLMRRIFYENKKKVGEGEKFFK